MSKVLFLGDSHSTGYIYLDGNVQQWSENNYADVYSIHFDKSVVVYAMPGASNQKYPIWLKSILDKHNDITEVFIQSTYWNRWLMGASRKLEYGDGTKSDLFLDDRYVCPRNNRIKYYTDWRQTDDFIEIVEQCRPELFEEYKGISYNPESLSSDWGPFHEKYSYTKLYHESITHLQYREYLSNLYIINSLCKEHKIKCHLWRINDRVYMPDDFYLFGNLDFINIVKQSAGEWILKHKNLYIDESTIDGEHYPYSIHKIIGEEYIPYIKGLANDKN
jgi:hypothetical protein